VDRRRVIRSLASCTALVVLLAACGGDDSDDGSSARAPAAEPAGNAPDAGSDEVDPGGVLRLAAVLDAGALNFDPAHAENSTQEIMHALYSNLLIDTGAGLEPGLADGVAVVDARTLRVDLRPGLVFSDGTPLDAEAVKFNLERTLEISDRTVGFRLTELEALDHVEVVDDLTALLHLSEPIAGHFMILLAGTETFLASPTAIRSGQDMSTQPVGAGPFLLEAAHVERSVTMVKSDTYWAADQVRLAGVEFTHSPGVQTTQTALLGGRIDWGNVNSAVSGGLTDPLVVENIPHPAMLVLLMCKSNPPLSDVRVREALSLATDREALAKALYAGQVEPAWSFGPEGSPRENPELRGKHARDVVRARALLAEAGYPDGFALDMMASAGNTVGQEVLQDQWAEVGVDINIITSPNTLQDFWVDGKAPTLPVTLTRGYLDALTIMLMPGAFSNVCEYRSPDIERTLSEALAFEAGSDEHDQAWRTLAALVHEELPFLPLTFHLQVVAYNSERVGGLRYIHENRGNVIVDYHGTFIKQDS